MTTSAPTIALPSGSVGRNVLASNTQAAARDAVGLGTSNTPQFAGVETSEVEAASGNLVLKVPGNGDKIAFRRADGVETAYITNPEGMYCNGYADLANAKFSLVNSAGLCLANDRSLKWSSDTNWYGTADVGVSRGAAGLLEINNGTSGTLRDALARYLYLTESAAPSTPASGRGALFIDTSGNLNTINDAGTVLTLSPSLTEVAVQNSAYTAVAYDHVRCRADTASATFAVTLPSGTPAAGTRVRVSMAQDDRGTSVATRKSVTIGRNGNLVNGSTDTGKWRLVNEGDYVEFVWVGQDTGWMVIDGIQPILALMSNVAGQTISRGISFTKLNFDTADVDPFSVVDTTNGRLYLPRAGYYEYGGQFTITANDGEDYLTVFSPVLNGTATSNRIESQAFQRHGSPNQTWGGIHSFMPQVIKSFAANDYLGALGCWLDSANNDSSRTTTTSAFDKPIFWAREIR